MEQVISRFDENYPLVANEHDRLLTARQYAKTVRYISIGEAVVEVFKAPYQSDLRFDAVRIYKGRKSNRR